MRDTAMIKDEVTCSMDRTREVHDMVGLHGTGTWEMVDGDTGEVRSRGEFANLVTGVGDQVYAERGAGVANALPTPTCAKLGTGTAAPTKTGAGAALQESAYIGTSSTVFDSTYPQSSLSGVYRRITYKFTFGQNVGTTTTPIGEIALCNSVQADATAGAEATVSRALISPGAKAPSDILTVVWVHDILGS
jgi:hypothetical protein